METQKEYLKIILLQRIYIRIDGYFTASIGNVSKEEAEIAYGTRVEIDAYIHWAEDPGILHSVL